MKKSKTINATVVEADIVFSIEGNETVVKKNLKKVNTTATDRFGLWVAKDYILIERKNDWLKAFAAKAIWTQFHIILNCQKFSLTANRGSVGNSQEDVITGLKAIINETFEELRKDSKFKEWEGLKEKEELEAKKAREYADLQKRLKNVDKKAKIDVFKDITVFKPGNEAETMYVLANLIFSKKIQKLSVPNLDFEILDIGSKIGIDLIVNWYESQTQSETKKLIEVEYKLDNFTKHKHFFRQVHAIICWEIGRITTGQQIFDLEGKAFEFKKGEAGYFFQNIKDQTDIKKVFVLSDIIKNLSKANAAPK